MQQTLVKTAEWAMAELPKQEVAVHLEWSNGDGISLASSPETLALIGRFARQAGMLGVFASGKDALIVSKAGPRRATRIFPAGIGSIPVQLELVTAERPVKGAQMWIDGADGGWVEFDFETPADETYRVVLHATRAINFGTVQCAIDSTPIGAAQDLYALEVIPSGPRELGTLELKKGPHKLRFTIAGRNGEASDFDFGFDALDLIPAGSASVAR